MMTESEGAILGATQQDFGDYLKSSRDAKALTLSEISRTTRIPVHALEHLEGGEFSKLPADVFVRGFLRSYAKCVGIDDEETIDAYSKCQGALVPAPVSVGFTEQATIAMNATPHFSKEEAPSAKEDEFEPAPKTEIFAQGSGPIKKITIDEASKQDEAVQEKSLPKEVKSKSHFIAPALGEYDIPSRKPLLVAALVMMIGSIGAMSYWMSTPTQSHGSIDSITR